MSLGTTWLRLEKDALVALLEAHGWVLTKASRASGIGVDTIRLRMRMHGIEKPVKAPSAPRVRRRRAPGRQFTRVGMRTWQVSS